MSVFCFDVTKVCNSPITLPFGVCKAHQSLQIEIISIDRTFINTSLLDATAREKAGWSDKLEASKIGSHVIDRGFVGAQAARTMKRSKAIERRSAAAAQACPRKARRAPSPWRTP